MIRLTPTQQTLILDILIEARTVAKQVAEVRPKRAKELTKRAKDIQLLINKVNNDKQET